MSELPEILDAEVVARLCGLNQEWVWGRRYILPCIAGAEPYDVRVQRADLPAWLEAAHRLIERHERREAKGELVEVEPREGVAVRNGDSYSIAWKR